MGKILFLLVLALIAYVAIKALLRPGNRNRDRDAPAEDMVACEHCGVNLPRSEALERRGGSEVSKQNRKGYCANHARHIRPVFMRAASGLPSAAKRVERERKKGKVKR